MTDLNLTEDDLDLLLARLRRPAIAMLRMTEIDQVGLPGCWFGGQPTLPADIDWPMYQVPGTDFEIPHHLLVQINLDYMPRVMGMPPLPKTGTLFVFYEYLLARNISSIDDTISSPLETGEVMRVIYVNQDVSGCPLREMPRLPDFSEFPFDLQMGITEFHPEFGQKEPFQFVVFDSYPGSETARAMGNEEIPSAYLARYVGLQHHISREVNLQRYPDGKFPSGPVAV